MIVLLFTGGTISMRHDNAAGGAVPALGAHEIVAAARGVEEVAALELEDWGRFPGPHMSTDRMWALRGRVVEHLDRPEIDGIVVTHGTDTLEESAYLATRSIASDKPIVFTGAMRAASELGWDGPANLIDSVRVAASKDARGYGALVVMGSRIFAGQDVTKAHTHMLDAFESPGLGPVGVVDDGTVIFRRALPTRATVVAPNELAVPVDIIVAHAGCDARLIDASRETARGIVVAALGRGNVPPDMAEVSGGRWATGSRSSSRRARRADAWDRPTDMSVEAGGWPKWERSSLALDGRSRPGSISCSRSAPASTAND